MKVASPAEAQRSTPLLLGGWPQGARLGAQAALARDHELTGDHLEGG